MADAATDRPGVQVGPERHPLRTELASEALDEVEVVAEAGVEDEVRCDLGDGQDISDSAKAAIVGGNGARLYGLAPPGSGKLGP
ncbi:MAG TPA: hypothetical protein VLV81_08380 [Acidimicrobiia bacterium]|nr:hypothetical protein [Acidimicrobiia bacterium]